MKVALTGGASGIGAEAVRKLQALGHHVTVFDLHQPEAKVDHWIKTDLSDSASIANALSAAEGPFDALINNAGLPPRDGQEPLILQVNFLGLRLFLDGMFDKMSKGAAIVNTASRAGAHWRENLDEVKALMALDLDGAEGFVTRRAISPARAYNLSKEALIVMTLAQTKQMLARGLRMNAVSPAAVSTGILDEFATAFGDRMAQNIARAGRPGTAEEIANVIVFLALPDSHWIKGQDIVIDGGMSALTVADSLNL